MKTIKAFKGEHVWLSNMYLVNLYYKGLVYPSSENLYHSFKNNSPQWKNTCTKTNPHTLKNRSRKITIVDDWEKIKVDVMRECLVLKFSHQDLRDKLIATHPCIIEEGNTFGDNFWGVDMFTREGENKLGKLLMEIRDKLMNDCLTLEDIF